MLRIIYYIYFISEILMISISTYQPSYKQPFNLEHSKFQLDWSIIRWAWPIKPIFAGMKSLIGNGIVLEIEHIFKLLKYDVIFKYKYSTISI